MSNGTRFSPELESLRGLAALMVAIGHCYLLLQVPMLVGTSDLGRFAAKLAHAALDPQPAVLLFFVISGFVLRLQLLGMSASGPERYAAFVTRRVFRLIPPMWASVCFATLLLVWQHPSVSDVSVILNGMFLRQPNANIVLWSLHVELYCSLLFPALFWLSKRMGLVGSSVLTGALGLLMLLPPVPAWLMSAQPGAALTVQYVVFFQAGLLAGLVGERFPALVGWRHAPVIVLVALAVCQLAPLVAGADRLMLIGNWTNWMWLEVPACFAAVLFLAHHPTGFVTRVLRSRPARFVGRVSFSVYLIHLPILVVLLPTARSMAAEWGRPTLILLTAAVLAPTFLLAAFSYKFVEVPSNLLGRELADRLLRRLRALRRRDAAGVPVRSGDAVATAPTLAGR